MTNNKPTVNTIAPLTNVSLAVEAMEQAINRVEGLPGIVCLYGPSGYGKSRAAAYVANKFRTYYVEGKSLWTRKSWLANILKDMGIVPERTMDLMEEQIFEQLALSQRPLILDEVDYLVDKDWASLLMDLHEGSNAPLLVIGEEKLHAKLKRKFEKVHNRVLKWVPAQPSDNDDCQKLAQIYSPDVTIADDLLDHINSTIKGCTRRVAVNLNLVRNAALSEGTNMVDLAWWGKRKLYTGEAPKRGE